MDTSTIVRNAQMDLLIELDRICKKWDIPYFLTYGTLLGAVRHDGFIPWDDDLDVGMLWYHYDRFREACKQDLDPAYMLHSWESDPNSPHPFMKLKICGTHYPEKLAAASSMNDAIYIDIFPYDSVSESKFKRQIQAKETYLLYKILLLRCNFDLSGESKLRKVLYGTLKFLSRIRSVEGWKKTMTRVRNRYNNGKASRATCMAFPYSFEKECVSCTVLETTIPHKFENGTFSIPKDYDLILRKCYGDYMQLPPEDQRVGHHQIQGVDLGNYTIRYNAEKEEAGDM